MYLRRRIALLALVCACTVLSLPAMAAVADLPDEVFYHIMPIAWRDGNNDAQRFGDFGGLTASLPYLQGLGVTAVWLNPIFPSPAYHGYQHGPADQLNPWFGDEAALTSFLEAAHAAGIKVFVDFVAYGVSRDAVYFQDAYANPGSVYDTWLAFTDAANTQYQGSTFTTWNGATVRQIWWDLRDPHPVDLVTQWASHWLDPDDDGIFSDGLDGYRLDHVWSTYPNGPGGWGYHIGSFWAPWRAALRAVNPDVVVFAEQADWGSYGTDLFPGMDAAFTKPFEFAARDALAWEDAGSLYSSMAATVAAHDAAAVDGTFLCTIGNHDVNRLATSIGDSFAKGKAAAAVLLTQPFTPNLYYGDEIGMRGTKNTGYAGDAADIPMREPFKWNAVAGPPMSNYFVLNAAAYAGRISRNNDGRSVAEQQGVSGSLWEAYRELIAARKASVALRRGGYAPVAASAASVWAFVRDHADQQVLVAINVSGSSRTLTLDLGDFAVAGGATVPTDLLSGATLTPLTDANRGAYPLTLGAYGYRLLQVAVTAPEPPASLLDGLAVADLAPPLVAQDTPTNLGDNVSELDRLFARVSVDSLFVGVTGNLATDGTGLCLLLDTAPGGQTVLDLDGVPVPPSGPELLSGLRLDDGFAPDQLLFVNAFAGNVYVDQYTLPAGGGAVKTYRGAGVVGSGSGLLAGGDNPHGIQVALDNRNTAGVTATSAAAAATALTGFEIYLPALSVGLVPGEAASLKLAAFLLRTDGTVTNQWLPGLGGTLTEPGTSPDLADYPGDQHVALPVATAVPDAAPSVFDLRVARGAGPDLEFWFRLPEAAVARLEVIDLRGHRVRTLLSGPAVAGEQMIVWDGAADRGARQPGGLYLARLTSGGCSEVRRAMLVR